jgi:predicted MFS family arabinose efflux permease
MTHPALRSPNVVLACGSLILLLALGVRQTFGLYLQPMSTDLGWGRETFALAIALQNLVWGLAQPFAGAIADKSGPGRVLVGAALFYCAGLALMAQATGVFMLNASAGLLIGFGLSGTSFGVVMGVVGRIFPPEKRSLALGIAGASGSFGQFIMVPYGQSLISGFGWQLSLILLAATMALIIPLSTVLSGRHSGVQHGPSSSPSSPRAAVSEALSHRGYWYLSASFLVCGFQTIFIMLHLPVYLIDQGLTPVDGMTALALIGLFNVVGSYLCGFFGGRYSKKRLLSIIYLTRSIAIALFLIVPKTPASAYVFAIVMGLTWLGTVPLTNGLVAQIFGVNFLSTLFGVVFLAHQIGAFLGAWYGGYIFDLIGSYLPVWIITIALGVLAAILCLPINERPIGRLMQKGTAA